MATKTVMNDESLPTFLEGSLLVPNLNSSKCHIIMYVFKFANLLVVLCFKSTMNHGLTESRADLKSSVALRFSGLSGNTCNKQLA